MGHEYLIQTLREYDKRLISLYPQVSGADGHLTYEKGAKEDLEYGRVNYIIFHGSGIFPDMDAFRDLMFQKHKIRIFNSHIATSHSQELSHKIAETYNSQVIAYLNKKHGSNIVEIEFDKWWDELWKKRRDNT
ncbi:hypothetical protein LNTAR_06304 [Lentisphaera araneosa HTCC2155]|uniref:Uncharacterized protein n=2 Tax=Lentisphaera TaxID=256846 RepID=A6DN87_9BACT|nr:hypothetical protein LNTAR_06304 [Lentisphaera araneosa HTCC2155]